MQLISAPESNKHENMKPPVPILNIVPCCLPLSMVKMFEGFLPLFK